MKTARCDICSSEKNVFQKRIPSDVILDREGNISDLVFGDTLPLCFSCFSIIKSNRLVPYVWVKKVLKTPYYDGRWRILDLVIMPYLANIKKLPKEKAVEIAWKWLESTKPHVPYRKRIQPFMYRQYLYNQYNHVFSQKLMPLTYENFKKMELNKYAVAG